MMRNEYVNSPVPSCGDVTQHTLISKQLPKEIQQCESICVSSPCGYHLSSVMAFDSMLLMNCRCQLDVLLLRCLSWCGLQCRSCCCCVWQIGAMFQCLILCRCRIQSSNRCHCVQLRSLCRCVLFHVDVCV